MIGERGVQIDGKNLFLTQDKPTVEVDKQGDEIEHSLENERRIGWA
jgi:hypothetical protein